MTIGLARRLALRLFVPALVVGLPAPTMAQEVDTAADSASADDQVPPPVLSVGITFSTHIYDESVGLPLRGASGQLHWGRRSALQVMANLNFDNECCQLALRYKSYLQDPGGPAAFLYAMMEDTGVGDMVLVGLGWEWRLRDKLAFTVDLGIGGDLGSWCCKQLTTFGVHYEIPLGLP